MDEIKIWTIDGSGIKEIQPTGQTKSEQWLEENLVSRPELLMPGLTLVGRQTQTEGGPLDLLGVDSDGRLALFELKRGMLSRDAVAQIVDYASYLEGMRPDALADYIANRSGANGIEKIDDFEEWYIESTEAESLESLIPLRMFLVGLGVDDRTERMVNFLANKGMDISLLTFYGFEYEGKTFLARQMRVESAVEPVSRPSRQRPSRAEMWDSLVSRARDLGVYDLFTDVMEIFRENWSSSSERIGPSVSFGLRERTETGRPTTRQYVRIDLHPGELMIVFYRRGVELCVNEFSSLITEIPYQTWPSDRKDNALESPIPEIHFLLTLDEWESHKEKINELTRSVYEAWMKTNQRNNHELN